MYQVKLPPNSKRIKKRGDIKPTETAPTQPKSYKQSSEIEIESTNNQKSTKKEMEPSM